MDQCCMCRSEEMIEHALLHCDFVRWLGHFGMLSLACSIQMESCPCRVMELLACQRGSLVAQRETRCGRQSQVACWGVYKEKDTTAASKIRRKWIFLVTFLFLFVIICLAFFRPLTKSFQCITPPFLSLIKFNLSKQIQQYCKASNKVQCCISVDNKMIQYFPHEQSNPYHKRDNHSSKLKKVGRLKSR